MKTLLLFALAVVPICAQIPAGSIWAINSGATSANVNGGLFDTGATFGITDGVGASATGNAPTLSSATYTFVAGDVGAWVYIVSNASGGANVFRGWCPIASQSGGTATLNATIGACVRHDPVARTYTVSTVAGIASGASPTAITFGVDYSQGTAAICAITDLVIDGTTNTDVSSAGCPFAVNHIGNGLKVASGTGFTQTWFAIKSIQAGPKARLDTSAGTLSSTGGVANLGGALSMASTLDDDVFEKGVAGNDFLVKGGTYALGETVSISVTGGTQNPIRIIGFNAMRGDNPTGSTRPTFTVSGTTVFTTTSNWDIHYMIFTGAGSGSTVSVGGGSRNTYSKFINTSTTAALNAFNVAAADAYISNCEMISYRGRGVTFAAAGTLINSYVHDSDVGVMLGSSGVVVTIINTLIVDNVTAAVSSNAAVASGTLIANSTLVGSTQTARGTGVNLITGVTDVRLVNNIITGFVTGVTHADAQSIGLDMNNVYYGNTNNSNANWPISASSTTTVNPTFSGVTYYPPSGGSSATSTSATLEDGAANFSGIVDGVDFALITGGSGTGFPASPTKFLILSHDTTHLTLSSNLTSTGSGSAITYIVSQGHNYAIGAGLAGLGAPATFPGGYTPSTVDPGAAQRPGGSTARTVIY